MIRVIVGAILGALGAYAYTSSPRFRRQIKGKKKAIGDGFRLPLPATTVELPSDAEDITTLDEVICECAVNLREHETELIQSGVLPDPATVTAEIYSEAAIGFLQLCSASSLYAPSEVPWPPMQGDHPTIHQLWGVVGFRIRRLMIRGELDEMCFGPGFDPTPEPKPEPPQAPSDIFPQG